MNSGYLYKLRRPGAVLQRLLSDPKKRVVQLGTAGPMSDDVLGDPTVGALGIQREAMLRGELFVEIIDDATGEVAETHTYNTLTYNFRAAIASLLVGGASATYKPSQMKLGTGATASMTYAKTNQDENLSLTSTGAASQDAFGQTFRITDTVEATVTLGKIMWWLKRIGSPGGTAYAELRNATGSPGLPAAGAPLATSSSISIGTIPAAYDWSVFSLPPGITVARNSYYAITIRTAGYTRVGGVNELNAGADASAASYADGNVSQNNAGTWSNGGFGTTHDAVFRLVSAPPAVASDVYGVVIAKNFTSTSNPTSNSARLLTNFTTSEGVEYIGHIGMFNAAGTLYAIAGVGFNKTGSQSVNVYWVIRVE